MVGSAMHLASSLAPQTWSVSPGLPTSFQNLNASMNLCEVMPLGKNSASTVSRLSAFLLQGANSSKACTAAIPQHYLRLQIPIEPQMTYTSFPTYTKVSSQASEESMCDNTWSGQSGWRNFTLPPEHSLFFPRPLRSVIAIWQDFSP